jgi:hypothetical protein
MARFVDSKTGIEQCNVYSIIQKQIDNIINKFNVEEFLNQARNKRVRVVLHTGKFIVGEVLLAAHNRVVICITDEEPLVRLDFNEIVDGEFI